MSKVSEVARQLKAMREEAGLTVQAVADAIEMPKSTYASYEDKYKKATLPNDLVQKLVPVFLARDIDEVRIWALAGLMPGQLKVDIHNKKPTAKLVATRDGTALPSDVGGSSAARYEIPLDQVVPVIGKVQAGYWSEAYQLPEEEWVPMALPTSRRFPGVARYGLLNEGQSMNKILPSGGVWVFVKLKDLTGVMAGEGDLVIVERIRGGEVEATCKRYRYFDGKPMLVPESDDPIYSPLSFDGASDEEIRIAGIVVGRYAGDL